MIYNSEDYDYVRNEVKPGSTLDILLRKYGAILPDIVPLPDKLGHRADDIFKHVLPWLLVVRKMIADEIKMLVAHDPQLDEEMRFVNSTITRIWMLNKPQWLHTYLNNFVYGENDDHNVDFVKLMDDIGEQLHRFLNPFPSQKQQAQQSRDQSLEIKATGYLDQSQAEDAEKLKNDANYSPANPQRVYNYEISHTGEDTIKKVDHFLNKWLYNKGEEFGPFELSARFDDSDFGITAIPKKSKPNCPNSN
jgi:hypothetical protein